MNAPASPRIQRLHHRILGEIASLRDRAEKREEVTPRAPAVSRWSVAEQLERLLQADRLILEELEGMAAGFSALSEGFERLAPHLGELEKSRTTSRHPLLGNFTAVRWLRFLSIHHRHHEKIMRDILITAAKTREAST